jgi:hypothetical protein
LRDEAERRLPDDLRDDEERRVPDDLRDDEERRPPDDFRDDERFDPERFEPPFFRGTFAPFFRASESPMAIACLRLFTFLPLPLFSVPRFRRRIALPTDFDAPFP